MAQSANPDSLLKVANAAARLSLNPPDGTVCIQLDTKVMYAYDVGTNSWIAIGSSGGAITIGNPVNLGTAPDILFVGPGNVLDQDPNLTFDPTTDEFTAHMQSVATPTVQLEVATFALPFGGGNTLYGAGSVGNNSATGVFAINATVDASELGAPPLINALLCQSSTLQSNFIQSPDSHQMSTQDNLGNQMQFSLSASNLDISYNNNGTNEQVGFFINTGPAQIGWFYNPPHSSTQNYFLPLTIPTLGQALVATTVLGNNTTLGWASPSGNLNYGTPILSLQDNVVLYADSSGNLAGNGNLLFIPGSYLALQSSDFTIEQGSAIRFNNYINTDWTMGYSNTIGGVPFPLTLLTTSALFINLDGSITGQGFAIGAAGGPTSLYEVDADLYNHLFHAESNFRVANIPGFLFLNLDLAGEHYQIGDCNFSDNGCYIDIYDAAGQINFIFQYTGASYTFPNTSGSSGQVLTTDGVNTLSWTTSSGAFSGVGAFDSVLTPSAQGLTFNSGFLFAQSASTTVPGMVNISQSGQTMTGQKLFAIATDNTNGYGVSGNVNLQFSSPSTGTSQVGLVGQVNGNDSFSHSSDLIAGVQAIVNWIQQDVGSVYGFNSQINIGSNPIVASTIIGTGNLINNNSTALVGSIYGTYNDINDYSTSTVNNLFGNYTTISMQTTGSYVTVAGELINISAVNTTGINDAYGVLIQAMPTTVASNCYGFYDVSNSLSQFGGINVMEAASANGPGLSLYAGANISSNFISFQVPNTLASNAQYILPATVPPSNTGYYLTANTSGTMSWATASGNSSVGTAGTIQFAGASGTFNGNYPQFFWNNTSHSLGIGTNAPSADLTVEKTTVGSAVEILVENNSNASGSDAVLFLQTNYTLGGGGDPKIQLNDGVESWALGVDHTTNHRFAIATSPSLSSNPAFTIDNSTGNVIAAIHNNGSGATLQLNANTGGDYFALNGSTATTAQNYNVPSTYPVSTAALTSDSSGNMDWKLLASGTWTPSSISGISNAASINPYANNYMQIGNNVSCSFIFDVVNITAQNTGTEFEFDLPVAPSFSNGNQLQGMFANYGGTLVALGYVNADSGSQKASVFFISPGGSTGQTISIIGTLQYTTAT